MSKSAMSRRICLVGASGLVGTRLMAQAVGREDVRLIGVARREVPLPRGARMEMLVAPVEGWADAIAASGAQALVCALGTTWRKAGKDEAAFRAVDHDLVVSVARAAKDGGIGQFILVSSVGADPASDNRYLRAKGEVEQAVGRLRFRRSDILRPGLIRGRRAESRPLERAGMMLSPLVDRLLWGGWRKYRSIGADELGQAALALVREKAAGHFIHEHDAIRYVIRRVGDNARTGADARLTWMEGQAMPAAVADRAGETRRFAGGPGPLNQPGAEGATAPESLRHKGPRKVDSDALESALSAKRAGPPKG